PPPLGTTQMTQSLDPPPSSSPANLDDHHGPPVASQLPLQQYPEDPESIQQAYAHTFVQALAGTACKTINRQVWHLSQAYNRVIVHAAEDIKTRTIRSSSVTSQMVDGSPLFYCG